MGEEVQSTGFVSIRAQANILATLLQREMVEVLVPVQAMLVLTLMYKVTGSAGLNGLVQGWDDAAYNDALWYLSLDFGVELGIFLMTLTTVQCVAPSITPLRILPGLFDQHFGTMTGLSFCAWAFVCVTQYTYAGMDFSFEFTWLHRQQCANLTWVGGLRWDASGCT